VIGSFLKPLVKYGALSGTVIIGAMTWCSIVVPPTNIVKQIERAGPVTRVVPAVIYPIVSSLEYSMSESDDVFYEKRIGAPACEPVYLESLEMNCKALNEGDVNSFIDIAMMVSEDLARSYLSRLRLTENPVNHTTASSLDLVYGELVRMACMQLKQFPEMEG
jgi:hypothetical protein